MEYFVHETSIVDDNVEIGEKRKYGILPCAVWCEDRKGLFLWPECECF